MHRALGAELYCKPGEDGAEGIRWWEAVIKILKHYVKIFGITFKII